MKHGDELIYSGAWLILIGAIISALGVTREATTESLMGAKLVGQGNAIGAFGNTLQALGNTELFQEDKEQFRNDIIIGCWLQAAGNSTNTVATEIEINTSEEEGHRLNVVGSGVLGLGAAYEAVGAAEGNSPTKNLEVTGNSLIALGAFLDAAGNVFLLKKLETLGDRLALIGGWTQVAGASVNVIAITSASNIEETHQKNMEYYWYE
ncbi:DUF6944 family repetitive protein [Psychrobacillus sp. NPDC058041]|uniref:DUF6944 family repetitive protein n=1 Tax=Psychrobacillus sp. NPDC058041 TaxID=3346310 RepID=UPI0036D81131